MNIALLLADGFEEIETITLIDLLRRANLNIDTISINSENKVTGGQNITIEADKKIELVEFDIYDALILPGGSKGVLNLASDNRVIPLVKEFNSKEKFLIAICAAPFLLSQAGIITNFKYTCYPSWHSKIDSGSYTESNVVVSDKIITSRGVGTAIDLGLKLIEIFISIEKSNEIKKAILY